MKPSLDKSRASVSRPPGPEYWFYEYHWDGPKRVHVPLWQPRQTTLVVMFEGQSRLLFSTARILLYYSKGSSPKDVRSDVWDVQQLGPMIHSVRGQVQNARPNTSTLPSLTVAFEVAVSQTPSKSSFSTLVLRPPAAVQDLSRESVNVLLERELSLTSDTLSLSLSFTHSTMLWTPITSGGPERMIANPTFRIQHVTTRIIRVLPPVSIRPRVTDGFLPTELLIKTFEDAEFRDSWHNDLLSFAQVCRAWSCAMDVLHSRLSFSDDDKRSQPGQPLDVYAVASALSRRPLLGYSFRHFTTNNFGKLENWPYIFAPPRREDRVRFTAALIAILRTTKNLQHLHLGQLDPCQADALFAVLHALRDVHTLSIGQVEDRPIGGVYKHNRTDDLTRMVSVVQLARCMARWPALRVLKLHHVQPGIISICRFALRPPMCALTQLSISQSHMGDRDLAHLFASSAKTLERVALDRIDGISNSGLSAFLLAISQNVVYLTIQDVALPPFRQWGHLMIGRTERALDVVVDKMVRLRELMISGDVASEFMLDRRSKMFVAHDISEETRVPVVRLWLEDVPRLTGFAADRRWPGWCTPGRVARRQHHGL